MKITDSPKLPFPQRAKTFIREKKAEIIVYGLLLPTVYDLLKGTSGRLFNTTLRALTFVFRGYVEAIHRDIGEARNDQFVRTIYTLLFTSAVVTANFGQS